MADHIRGRDPGYREDGTVGWVSRLFNIVFLLLIYRTKSRNRMNSVEHTKSTLWAHILDHPRSHNSF